ncbi:MAG: heavy metal translocating P-type ATPase [Candidatus Cyclonatronum sp.]|uniref:heavy metal translocating P-type ATPase n=1 Tax=Cyclonatronum sp. TaxID=3024185 RepID=UPI0025C6A5FC|nr:heavy metal translocating P-type ATPase [Cyclonatronum sp.]MCH8485227.1 heavy metal translocating P-type ATPase [Cyclonatronum sp.]
MEATLSRIRFDIKGMSCASCVSGVEKALSRVEGVEEVSVNLATNQAEVVYEAGKISEERLMQAVDDAGFEAVLPETKKQQPAEHRLKITGMSCASCVTGVEKAIARVPGTRDVSVNLATGEARFFRDEPDLNPVIEAVDAAGFEAEAITGNTTTASPTETEGTTFRRRFFIALPLALLVSVMDMGPMFIHAWHEAIHPVMFEWNLAQLLLTGFIMFYAGSQFFTGAWKAVKRKSADMNVLVAVGTGAAFLFSGYATFFGREGGLVEPMDVYFDTAAVIIALILLGRWMEERARNKSRDALGGLLKLTPPRAHRIGAGGQPETITLDQVRTGDELLVKAFEQVPVDGEVLSGSPSLDESMMTGESVPADKTPGDAVTGGTRNTNQSFRMKATAVGEDTALARLIEAVRRAQGSKPPIQRLVDKVAAVFVPVVIVIALITLLAWMFLDGDPAKAVVNMVAVLIIACPCALGLATPTGIMVGSGRAAEKGILIKDAITLEEARKADVILLDKTGTLTTGEMQLTGIFTTGSLPEEELLSLAASVEQESDHPIAQAVVRYAKQKAPHMPRAESTQTQAGTGITGVVNGEKVQIGSVELLGGTSADVQARIDTWQEAGRTVLVVLIDGETAGLLSISDEPREDAAAFVKQLKAMNIMPVMVTGDQEKTARYVAGKLGIEEVRFGVKPDEKAQIVQHYQQQGKHVAMVGDGINDAAALVQADLGIALSSGTDLAVSSADITIAGASLGKVAEAITLSRSVLRIIRQNLFWAFVYNTVGIPLAAFGILSPMFAALAMALSSVSVVGNSLRIRKL